MSKLENKVALITGGNSGIGLATAKLFAAERAQVIITGRRKEAVEAAVQELGSGVTGKLAEASNLGDTRRLIEDIKKDHDKIDVLVINAGVAPFASLADTDEASFDKAFDINVKGLFFTLQAALPLLKAGSSVILTSSVVQKAGFPGAIAYAASKAAVRSIGQTAALELAERGIRVNVLSPGPIETPIFGKAGLSNEALDDVAKDIASKIPLGRFGQAEEMAKVALFLASDASSYVTGADIQADGGYSQKVA